MKLTKFFTLCLSFLLISIVFVGSAEATGKRSATIDEVVGTVWVQKAGGHLPLRAYVGMSLEQGDRLTTSGAYSSAIIAFPDTKDQIIVAENAEIRLTDLRIEAGHSMTRVTVLSGQVFASVTPITNEQDVFEIRTPDQTARAKGTNFYVGVDPLTGGTSMTVFSGIVQGSQTNPTTNQGSGPVFVYPGQQMHGFEDNQPGDPRSVIDIAALANQVPPAVLEEIVKAKEKIDRENAELLNRLKDAEDSPSSTDNAHLEDLDRLERNLSRLLNNIIKQAIAEGTINEQAARRLIDELNFDVDIDTPEELDYTAAERERLAELRRAQEERLRQANEKQEAEKLRNEELMKKLQAQRAQQAAQHQKKLEEQRQEAEKRLQEQLNAAQKAAFEAAQRKKEEERRAQEAAAEEMKKKTEPAPQPGSSWPSPNPISKVDRDLAAAMASIPEDLEPFTDESRKALLEATELPAGTDEEKIAKTEAIKKAVRELEMISYQEIKLRHFEVEGNELTVGWEEYPGAASYQYFINDESEDWLEEMDSPIQGARIGFDSEKLETDGVHTLKIVALDEEGQKLVEKVIQFAINLAPIDLFVSVIEENKVRLQWDPNPDITRYELHLNGSPVGLNDGDEDVITYDFNIDRSLLYTIEIKAFNESDDVIASKTLLTDFTFYME